MEGAVDGFGEGAAGEVVLLDDDAVWEGVAWGCGA